MLLRAVAAAVLTLTASVGGRSVIPAAAAGNCWGSMCHLHPPVAGGGVGVFLLL